MSKTKENAELQSQFCEMQNLVLNKFTDQFGNVAAAQQIVSDMTIALAKEPAPVEDLKQWIAYKMPRAIESYFDELRQYCYKHAITMTSNPELAEDIAQESINALLKSFKDITYIKGWLKRTNTNFALRHFKDDKKKVSISERALSSEWEPENPNSVSEQEVYENLGQVEVKRLLKPKDYSLYRKLKKYKTLKKYSEAVGVSYQTAREHSHMIRTNLKAAYYRDKGWDNLSVILDYRLVINIKHFMQKLVDTFGVARKCWTSKYNLRVSHEILYEVFTDVEGVSDWGVNRLQESKYEILICFANDSVFAMIVCLVRINKSNRITLIKCERKKVGLIARVPDELYPKVKKMITTNTYPRSMKEFDQMIIDAGYPIIERPTIGDFKDIDWEKEKNSLT